MRFHVVCVALLAMLSAAANAQLEAYWQAFGNVDDSSGYGHNGTTVGGVGYGSGVFGDGSFLINGGYLDVPASTDWGFGNNPFTINLWANFTAIDSTAPGDLGNTFMAQDAGGGFQNKWVFFYDTGNLYFHINGPGAGGSAFLASPGAVAVTTGVWNMYTITRSGDTYTFYFDGVDLGSDTSTLNVPYSATDLTMGQAEGLGQVAGAMSDIRIYGQALDPGEVKSLYAIDSVPGPIALAPFAAGVLALLRRLQRRPDLSG